MRRRNAVLLLLATAVVGTTAWLLLRPSPEDDMAAFVADLCARGEPLTLADMQLPLPPDDENGADDLGGAFTWLEERLAREDLEILDRNEDARDWESQYVGPWNSDLGESWHESATPEQLDELREFLSTLGPFYEGVAAATNKREIAWPYAGHDTGPTLFGPKGFDSIGVWLDARKLLETRAVVANAVGDRLDAMEWLLALVRRVRLRTASDDRHAAIYRRESCAALRDGVEAGHLDARTIRPQVDGLLRGGSVATMPRLLRAERTMWIEQFPGLCDGSLQAQHRTSMRYIARTLYDGPPQSRWEKLGDPVYEVIAGVRFDGCEYVASLREIDALIPPEGAWSRTHEAAFTAFESLPGPFQGAETLKSVERVRSADAAEALARVALAACEHRANNGDWPQSSADLSPHFADGVPVDPYTDAPFVMTRDGSTLALRASRPGDVGAATDEKLRDAALEWRLPPW